MISIGQAGALNAAVYEGPKAPLPEGWAMTRYIQDAGSGTVMAHYSRGNVHYLAVRGTWGSEDAVESLKVFFGKEPARRIEFLQDYIERNFQPICRESILVGGHSLGGLVAAAAAQRWGLAGLAQNAPGWMQPREDQSNLDRFLEIRTSRDVVGDWGSEMPRCLVLRDPGVPGWSLSGLHSLDRQNRLLQDHGLEDVRVDDPTLVEPRPCNLFLPGIGGLPRRIARTLRRRREEQAHPGPAELTPEDIGLGEVVRGRRMGR